MFWQGMAIDEIKEMASRLFCDAGTFFFLPRAGPKRQNKNTTTTLRLFQRRPNTGTREQSSRTLGVEQARLGCGRYDAPLFNKIL